MREWVKWSPEAWFAVTALIVATSACGSNPRGLPLASAGQPPSGAPAGNGNSGNPNAGAGGTSAYGTAERDLTPTLDTAKTTKYSACVTYTKAQCQRRAECGELNDSADTCAWSLDRCPDLFFAPGAAWTVESLLSCAETWKEFSCDDVRQRKRPGCAMPKGTRKVEEPCLFPNQCESNTCADRKKDGTTIVDYPDCGVCGETSDLGGPCDVYGYECGLEFECASTRKCVKRPTVGVVGDACDDNSTCAGYGISCRKDSSDGEKRCLPYPVEGESCAESTCADGYYCSDEDCVSGAALGETCSTSPSGACGVGLVCTGRFEDPASTCITGHKLGESCTNIPRLAPRGNCESGLRCDCGELECDVASGICREARAEGESCNDENSMCVPGTVCIDDKCRALEAQPALMEFCPI